MSFFRAGHAAQVVTRAALAAALCLAVGSAPAAPKQTARSKQKATAEAARAGIQQKLANLKKEISRTEAQKEDVADQLAESEEAISDANRELRDLAEEQDQTNRKLTDLDAQRTALQETIDAQKKQIAKLLKEHYVAGNEDRIKLLLSGDNPNRINRDLQMMAYVSQAQAKLLESLRQNLASIETNQQATQNAKDELEEIADEQRQQKATLEKEKAKRAELLAGLSKKLQTQRKDLTSLQRDEERLGKLVDNLAKIIREQQIAAAAAAKKRQEEAAARAAAKAKAQAERERIAKLNAANAAKNGKASTPFKVTDPIDDDEPPKPAVAAAPAAPEPAEEVVLAPPPPDGSFDKLKGQMVRPVAGQVVARFGSKRGGEGVTWKGVFIRASEGADVRVVAPGRIVFSGWMRGFGNLVVVDHGNDYMSVYGYNQSLLKHVGDAVKGGDAIATAGSTGGNEETGLYFEIRRLGRPIDPAQWVKF
ncbi:protease [Massilia arenosa]|uniref:Protease n=1 Tax=Zemynaea arenosa TaxID=2561931 RepID=A0A4Y9SJ23_9BURK|nr:peptidoglycan DD-metalloendopeptidase family protein [Massilia arenosa]TFW22144.1 protease [Massilia arenosa]